MELTVSTQIGVSSFFPITKNNQYLPNITSLHGSEEDLLEAMDYNKDKKIEIWEELKYNADNYPIPEEDKVTYQDEEDTTSTQVDKKNDDSTVVQLFKDTDKENQSTNTYKAPTIKSPEFNSDNNVISMAGFTTTKATTENVKDAAQHVDGHQKFNNTKIKNAYTPTQISHAQLDIAL
ncbi:MAG: hypothetical protein PHV37_02440 [Candidatus Gastranaerophilales bacterium]|nr:hypothetical protein [Candidatus Gastranaerophilales bacterium]